jgi:Uma2 family endonuclease
MSTVARLSIAEYDRAIAAGVFDGPEPRRIELIRGELREMSLIGPPHETCVDILNEWSIDNAPRDKVLVRVQNSIQVPPLASVPQPDLSWVARRDYSRVRPSAKDILLLVEVSDSSLAYDQGEKADLFAAARIADYWIVNLPERHVEVRRQPLRRRYRSVTVYRTGQKVPLLALPRIAFPVSTQFKR